MSVTIRGYELTDDQYSTLLKRAWRRNAKIGEQITIEEIQGVIATIN